MLESIFVKILMLNLIKHTFFFFNFFLAANTVDAFVMDQVSWLCERQINYVGTSHFGTEKISKAHSTTDEVQSSKGNSAGTAKPSETLNPNKRLDTHTVPESFSITLLFT